MQALSLVKGFVQNLLHLVRAESMLNVEGILGGMFLVFAIPRLITLSTRVPPLSGQFFALAVWMTVLALIGGMMLYGAVQQARVWRLWGCRAGMVAVCGISFSYALSGQFLIERLSLPLYFLFSLCLLYWRIINEKTQEGVAHGRPGLATDSQGAGSDDSGVIGGERRDMEVSGLAARAAKVGNVVTDR